MRKALGILGLGVIILGSYFYFQGPKEVSAPEVVRPVESQKVEKSVKSEAESESVVVAAAPEISPVVEASPAEESEPEPPGESRFSKKPRDMMVEFELVNGFAVAYGDTILGKPTSDFSGKHGITEMAAPRYWDGGVVPYLIKKDVPSPERIQEAINFFNKNTNVRFVPYEDQPDAVVFSRGEKHCVSYLGRTGGIQPIYLADDCGPTEIMHELMHAIGFVHEQSRLDRDQYIDVLWNNIEEPFQSQFAMVPEPLMQSYFDSPFDQHSIMMYEPHIFSIRDDLETMKLKSGDSIGMPSRKLTASDIKRVNRLYQK